VVGDAFGLGEAGGVVAEGFAGTDPRGDPGRVAGGDAVGVGVALRVAVPPVPVAVRGVAGTGAPVREEPGVPDAVGAGAGCERVPGAGVAPG
jgi:hypothetical protein